MHLMREDLFIVWFVANKRDILRTVGVFVGVAVIVGLAVWRPTAKELGRWINVFTVPAVLFGLYFALRRARTADKQADTAAKQAQTVADRHLTERFSEAANLLGQNRPDTQVAAIYAFERIAWDSPERDHWTVMELLCTWAREYKPREGNESRLSQTQAILMVLRRRNREAGSEKGKKLDLHGADLRGYDLREAHLEGACLTGADFSGSDLRGAYLTGADLVDANFLGETKLIEADLSEAVLVRANLSETYLNKAKLNGAKLLGANLNGADIMEADLRGANLCEADLREAKLNRANLSGANLNGADLRKANLYRANLSGASLLVARLHGANFQGAAVTQEQLAEAWGDQTTRLPNGRKTLPAEWTKTDDKDLDE